MGNMLKREWFKRLIAVTLSLVVAVTFIPLLGDAAFAEGEDAGDKNTNVDVVVDDTGGDVAIDVPDDVVTEDQSVEIQSPVDEPTENDEAIQEDGDALLEKVDAADCDLLSATPESEPKLNAKATILASFQVKMNDPYKVMHVEAKFNTNVYAAAIIIDGDRNNPLGVYSNGSILSDNININHIASCRTHVVTLLYRETSSSTLYQKQQNLIVSIYDRPSASLQYLEAYHNYITFRPAAEYNLVNYNLGVDYSPDGVNWYPGATMAYYNAGTISGLYANTNYSLRTYFVSKDGAYSGKQTGNFLYVGTYRTGVGAAPKIKSIKVKATGVKKKTQKVYGYYTGLYLGKTKYYKYKIKITVKLKKAPGTNGIWINGKKFKGNKKKYTVKLGPYTNYSKPKGKKFTVMIYSYYNNSYGGYSPMYRTVKKVK